MVHMRFRTLCWLHGRLHVRNIYNLTVYYWYTIKLYDALCVECKLSMIGIKSTCGLYIHHVVTV